jgi:hypothetical protein
MVAPCVLGSALPGRYRGATHTRWAPGYSRELRGAARRRRPQRARHVNVDCAVTVVPPE